MAHSSQQTHSLSLKKSFFLHFLQANGEVERAVQTIKNLLKKASDQYKALMAYRATPLESGLSSAELSDGKKNPYHGPYPTNPTGT